MNMPNDRSRSHFSFRMGWLPWLAVTLVLLLSGTSIIISASTPATVPLVSLSSAPLYAAGLRAKPTLTLALSVEFPTVGAQYLDKNNVRGNTDATYSPNTAYIGYFNPDLCYKYDLTGQVFNPSSATSTHTCGGTGFSGNFMNWAASSAIDILRYGLTGGDRVQDDTSTTVLQRAVLPSNFYNSTNFPSKQLAANLVAGALPNGLLTRADGSTYSGTVYIANCLNQIFFGTQATGNCGTPGNNANLGQLPTITSANSRPNGSTLCAAENATCTLPSSPRLVYYGANQNYYVKNVTTSVTCNNATFGDPLVSAAKSCYYAPSITQPTTSSDGSKSSTPYFLTRVTVCQSMSGATADIRIVNSAVRPFCTLYPNRTYKPTGNLQASSDRIRVAAFGYLLDNTNARYGGVLRAPMKYVGSTAYDSDFNLVSGGNTQSEWDPNTGIFATNPMGETTAITPRTTPISGVINYLNQFGRTGTPGTYKTYDPVNELYYEALRYIQGLSPTPQATDGMTDTMKDGFPVYNAPDTPSSSSHAALTTALPASPAFYDPQPKVGGLDTTNSYTCVRNNILTIGDIHTHYDKSLPGNTNTTGDFTRTPPSSPANNEPDFSFWTQVVGGFESNTAVSYIDGAGVTRNTLGTPFYNVASNAGAANLVSSPQMTNPSDNSNYFMAGAAYWANTHDIRGVQYNGSNMALAGANTPENQRPGMRATTYMIDVNEYSESTQLSNRRNNQFFLTAKYGGFKADGSQGGNPFVSSNGTYSNGGLWERSGTDQGALGGDPLTYFLVSDAAAMLNSLDQIFAAIISDTASIAGTSVTNTSVTTTNGGSVAYRSTFSPTDWTGDVYPLLITTDANNNISLTESKTTPGWEAKTQFQHIDTTNWTNRKLVVGSDTTTGGTPSNDGTPAIDFKSFGSLTTSQQSQIVNGSTVDGQVLVDYLSGDHSKEAPASAGLRARSTALGDIVNSGVIYEGAPSTAITDSSYLAVISGTSQNFYDTYKTRTAAIYVGANDGMLHAFNAANGNELFGYIPSFVVPKLNALTSTGYVHQSYVDATPVVGEAQLDTAWKTVLLSGTGGGGQGVFALDVTNPAAFDKTKVIWEFTDKNDSDMGNVIGTPGIYKFQTNAGSTDTPIYKWYAVVASGVNNYASDGHVSLTGNPAIFILDLSKAAGDPWALGTNYYKISLPQASNTQAMGVANFSVYAPNGVVSRIYAGDLQGNLWALKFSGVSAGANTWDFHVNANSTGAPLFIAKTGTTSTDSSQPITDAPEITGYGGNLILLFGTGKYIESSDNSAPYLKQTAYAVLDPVSTTPALTRGYLSPLTASNGAISGGGFAWGISADPTSPTNNVYAGWYFDLPSSATSGERFISNFIIYAGTVFANSIIPSANGCSGGSSNSYVFNLFGSVGAGGAGSYVHSTVGLLGPPNLVFVGTPTQGTNPNTGGPNEALTYTCVQLGSTGVGMCENQENHPPTGVRSWRQIFSHRDITGH